MATTTQTVRIGGVRTIITTRNGKVTTKAALPLEEDCQAEQIKMLRRLPQYGTQFLLAGDQNAEARGPIARGKAVATGMTAGEPDLRIYLVGGRVKHIENKVTGRKGLSADQERRHAELTALGHEVVVVWSTTPEHAAKQAVEMVRVWVAENDNNRFWAASLPSRVGVSA